MQQIQGVLNVTGRLLLCAIFLMAAVVEHIPRFHEVTNLLAARGIPWPAVVHGVAVVFLIAGSLAVITGYQARLCADVAGVHGAGDLSVPRALGSSRFQRPPGSGDSTPQESRHPWALLMILANGAGPMSIIGFQARK